MKWGGMTIMSSVKSGCGCSSGGCSSGAEDAEGVAADEGFGDLGAGSADDAVEGLARHAHAVRGVLAVESLEIREAEGFHFIRGKFDLEQVAHRNAGGFEIVGRRPVADAAGTEWAGH